MWIIFLIVGWLVVVAAGLLCVLVGSIFAELVSDKRVRLFLDGNEVFLVLFGFLLGFGWSRYQLPTPESLDWKDPISAGWFVIACFGGLTGGFVRSFFESIRKPIERVSQSLTGWQRLGLAFSLILLLPTILAAITAFPEPDSSVISDLNSLNCLTSTSRTVADAPGVATMGDYLFLGQDLVRWDGSFWISVKPGEPCYSLFTMRKNHNVRVATQEQYNRFLRGQKGMVVAIALGIWLGFSLLIYSTVILLGWVRKGFKPPDVSSSKAP